MLDQNLGRQIAALRGESCDKMLPGDEAGPDGRSSPFGKFIVRG